MIEVWLYGKHRRHAPNPAADANSVVHVPALPGDRVVDVLRRIGLDPTATSNIFLNGELSGMERPVCDGDRLGVFPDDMGLLYKWYFERAE